MVTEPTRKMQPFFKPHFTSLKQLNQNWLKLDLNQLFLQSIVAKYKFNVRFSYFIVNINGRVLYHIISKFLSNHYQFTQCFPNICLHVLLNVTQEYGNIFLHHQIVCFTPFLCDQRIYDFLGIFRCISRGYI